MKVVIIGCGFVGKELAKQLQEQGHYVIGTTTTAAKVDNLKKCCNEVRVLVGGDKEAVHQAAQGCDAIIVTAGPSAQQAMTPEQRRATYHKILVDSAESASTAPINGPIIALSSLSVYGDAANHLDVIDENSPLTTADDASPQCFQLAERTYMKNAPTRSCVFRCADICGGEDPPAEVKIRMAHQVLGGSVPFHDEALFYRVHCDDVVAAILHALKHKLVGIYNLTHAEVPPTCDQYFGALCDLMNLPHLKFRNELRAPTKPVSVKKMLDTGFTFEYTKDWVPRIPDANYKLQEAVKPKIDYAGKAIVLKVLDEIVKKFDLQEHYNSKAPTNNSPALSLLHQGKEIGSFRVFKPKNKIDPNNIDILIYSAMTMEDFGMDTHQIYAFTNPTDPRPSFTLDLAISQQTKGTFHIGLDLIPKVDLSASLLMLQQVYEPLSLTFSETMKLQGFEPAVSIGPLARALRSPWMIAAYIQPEALAKSVPAIEKYLQHWSDIVSKPLAQNVLDEAKWQDIATRHQKNRDALFSPETNKVWVLLERLVGADTVKNMRGLLTGTVTSSETSSILLSGDKLETRLFINNEFRESTGSITFPVINPTTEELICNVHEAQKEDVDLAVAAARAAFADNAPWRQVPSSVRRDFLLKLSNLVERDRDYICKLESMNCGKPVGQLGGNYGSVVDLYLVIQVLRYFAGHADKLTGTTIPVDFKNLVYTIKEPVGVCGSIVPWNFPLLMLVLKMAPMVAAGCTGVLKSSEKTPLTALYLGKLIVEAGFPPGVVNIISGAGKTGEMLVRHPDVNKISFTGSTAVGKKLQQYIAEAPNVKRSALELGGKSPMIILNDCDLKQAAMSAYLGLFLNNGQVCCAGSRCLVQSGIYDEFIAELTKLVNSRKLGDPFNPATEDGPIVDKIQFGRVMGYIEKGKQGGAKCLTGGERYGDKGYFIKPTLFVDVKDDMVIAQEEIFGPVLAVLKFDTLEEAIERANKTMYGLAAGVCTRDVGKAILLASKVQAGTVWVNTYNIFDAAQPFGGFKMSGYGRELGADALQQYLETKVVVIPMDGKN